MTSNGQAERFYTMVPSNWARSDGGDGRRTRARKTRGGDGRARKTKQDRECAMKSRASACPKDSLVPCGCGSACWLSPVVLSSFLFLVHFSFPRVALFLLPSRVSRGPHTLCYRARARARTRGTATGQVAQKAGTYRHLDPLTPGPVGWPCKRARALLSVSYFGWYPRCHPCSRAAVLQVSAARD